MNEDYIYNSLENSIGNRLRDKKELAKDDLQSIVEWKFRGRLLGRRKRILNLVYPVSDSYIKNLSKTALNDSNDIKRVEILMKIDGVGISLASCILSFYDPKNYGVYDIHIWRELFGKEPQDFFSKADYYMDLLTKLREIASQTNFYVRDVEKALFQKNLEESAKNHKLYIA